MPLIIYIHHCDLDSSVFVSLFRELFCFDNVLYSLSYAGSRDLVRQWPAVHNQNKQIFLYETFKTRCASLLVIPVIGILLLFSASVTSHPPVSCLTPSAKAGVGCWMEPIFNSGQDVEIDRIWWEDVFGSKDFKIKSPFHRKHLHDVLLNVLYA